MSRVGLLRPPSFFSFSSSSHFWQVTERPEDSCRQRLLNVSRLGRTHALYADDHSARFLPSSLLLCLSSLHPCLLHGISMCRPITRSYAGFSEKLASLRVRRVQNTVLPLLPPHTSHVSTLRLLREERRRLPLKWLTVVAAYSPRTLWVCKRVVEEEEAPSSCCFLRSLAEYDMRMEREKRAAVTSSERKRPRTWESSPIRGLL